jgi:hypothetical protein
MNNNKYKDTGLGRIGNAISQLGHALAWGSSDVSISSKSGYMADVKGSKYWKVLKWIIDFAFMPIDGNDHGTNAMNIDPDEDYDIGIGLYQDVVCSIFVVVVCPIVAVVLWSIHGIKKIKRYVTTK